MIPETCCTSSDANTITAADCKPCSDPIPESALRLHRLVAKAYQEMMGYSHFPNHDRFIATAMKWLREKYAWYTLDSLDVPDENPQVWAITLCSVDDYYGHTLAEVLARAVLKDDETDL